jgi:Nucleoside diphosphate kinase
VLTQYSTKYTANCSSDCCPNTRCVPGQWHWSSQTLWLTLEISFSLSKSLASSSGMLSAIEGSAVSATCTLRWHFSCSKLRMCHLSKAEAAAFYQVHRDKPFFEKLTSFMSSGEPPTIQRRLQHRASARIQEVFVCHWWGRSKF